MIRATRFHAWVGRYGYHPCVDCESPRVLCFGEEPYPGHNLGTLYECQDCGATISLADWGNPDTLEPRAEWLP